MTSSEQLTQIYKEAKNLICWFCFFRLSFGGSTGTKKQIERGTVKCNRVNDYSKKTSINI